MTSGRSSLSWASSMMSSVVVKYARPAYTMLSDPGFLNEYAILFVNCSSGIDWRAGNPEIQQLKDNVRNFVRQGGSLYVSDLAVDWVRDLAGGNTVQDECSESRRCA